jgi:hypothetical protein
VKRRFLPVMALLVVMLSATSMTTAASATTTATCSTYSSWPDPIIEDVGEFDWGFVHSVHSAGCNHWASAELHAPLPYGYQVNVTLTRFDGDRVADHRYCYIKYKGRSCYTQPVIHTEGCNWRYSDEAALYHWNGSSWDKIGWNRIWSIVQNVCVH